MSSGRGSSNRQKRGSRARGGAHDRPDRDARRSGPASQAVADTEDEPLSYDPSFEDFDVPQRVEEFVENVRQLVGDASVELGRVIRLDRSYPLVLTRNGTVRAEHAIALVKGGETRAAIGDWVAVGTPSGHDKAVIESIFERSSQFARWDAGSFGTRQVLAANIETVLAVQPLSKRGPNCDRLVRSAVLAREGGCAFAVILTKCDRVDQKTLHEQVQQVDAALAGNVEVVVTSSKERFGLENVLALVPEGSCALLLGESGAGKSTMVNELLNDSVLDVGEVRERDDQGRHTTVARRMMKIPGAGLLVDAPGLRSLPLLDETRGMALTFPEIDALLGGCRFRDCTHGAEPGCAVTQGVRDGLVDAARLALYRTLAQEMVTNRRSLDLAAPSSITK